VGRTFEIAIVLPVFNEEENLSELLRKILRLKIARLKIIVVEYGSAEGTARLP